MNNYKYQLEKYSGRNSRYTCPQCGKAHRFTRYIDTETGQHLAQHVGRCDREVECGYHETPRGFFQDIGYSIEDSARPAPSPFGRGYRKVTTKVPYQTSGIHHQISANGYHPSNIQHQISDISPTLGNYAENNLVAYLSNTLGPAATEQLITQYRIGTHHHWRGSTVYWYINKAQQPCSGKVMLYNPQTGKRVKEPFNHVTWMHSLLGMEGFVRQPCFFGEHLLTNTTLPVSIVESEKTALVAAHYLPGSIWLATGGLSSLNIDHCRRVLRGRKLTLFPDAGAYDKWLPIAAQLPNCNISRMIEYYHALPGDDLADMLVRA